MVDSERFAVGMVASTRSSDRNCRRLALTERLPQSKRRFRPPSESMDWVTSRGSKELRRTNDELDAYAADIRSCMRSDISQLCWVSNASSVPPSARQKRRKLALPSRNCFSQLYCIRPVTAM